MKNHSIDKKLMRNKKINLYKVLNDEKFISSSNAIQMALNKDRLVKKDFRIIRAKPKINIGKSSRKNLSLSSKRKKGYYSMDENNDNNIINKNNKNIPFELADILDINNIKFDKVCEVFNDIKDNNNLFSQHWDYVQKSIIKLKNKDNNKHISGEEENNEFYRTYKKYNFSTRDQIELELQKKLTTKLFKSNPLMIKNNIDMYFYYLSQYKDKSLVLNEQNPAKYMTKVKEYLDYIQEVLDYKNADELNMEDEAQNNKYLLNHQKKLEEEQMKCMEEQQKQDLIDTLESKEMIKQTKSSIRLLNNNINFYEDPKYFSNKNLSATFYKNNTKNFLNTNKKKFMSKSSSGFFTGNKHNIYDNDNDKYKTIKILQDTKRNLSNKLFPSFNIKAKKKINSSQDAKNFSSLIKKINIESQQKNKSNNIEKSKGIEKSYTNKYTLKNRYKNCLPTLKKIPIQHCFTPKDNLLHQRKSNVSSFISHKLDNSSQNQSQNNNDSNPLSLRKSILNDSTNKKINESKRDTPQENNIERKFSKNNKNAIISELYDIAKSDKEIKENDLERIKNFISQKENKYKKKKNTVNLIKEIQILSDGFDINKVSKNIENFPDNEIKQIKNFKKINVELNKLDKEYVRQICQFKALNERNDADEEI